MFYRVFKFLFLLALPPARGLWAKKYFAFMVCMSIIGLIAGVMVFVQLEVQYMETLLRTLGADTDNRILVNGFKWDIRYLSLLTLVLVWYMAGVVK